MKADYTLYLVTDRRAMSAETLEAAVEQALLGGVYDGTAPGNGRRCTDILRQRMCG